MEMGLIINLYEDERVLLVLRRHWLAFINTIVVTLILLLIFFTAIIVLNGRINDTTTFSTTIISQSLTRGVFVIFSSMTILSILAYFYISWLDYYLDIFVITNKRILRVEQLVLFGQNISETSLQHIQDVSSKVGGIIYTILNVGTVFIETAGERANFNFTFIKDPGDMAARILELQKEMWNDEGFKEDMLFERKNEKIEKMNTGNNFLENKPHLLGQIASSVKKNVQGLLQKSTTDGGAAQTVQDEATLKQSGAVAPNPAATNQNHYRDGRKVIPEGVVWQSEQNPDEDVMSVLNGWDNK